MTFTNKTPDSKSCVPFGWDAIEADDVPESEPSSPPKEGSTSFSSAEAVDSSTSPAPSKFTLWKTNQN